MTSARWRQAGWTVLGTIVGVWFLATLHEQWGIVPHLWSDPCLWLALGAAIGIARPELGHALYAAIVSIPIRLVVIGVGPVLWQRRFSETWFELRLLPSEASFCLTRP